MSRKTEELTDLTNRFNESLNRKPVDERTIVNILTTTTSEQRQTIRSLYKSLYGHPIQNDISLKLSYKFKDLCIQMFDTIFEYDAKEIHRALHFFINDDKTLVEIFASRPQTYFELISKAYLKFYKISLRDDLQKEIGKNEDYLKFILAIMDTPRPIEQTISVSEAYDYANKIKTEGLKKIGNNVELFKEFFIQKSREDLILIARAYNELFKTNLYEEISSSVGGKNRRLMKGIMFAVITPAEWFAKKLYKAIQGLGTDTNSLNRTLVTRAEVDMNALRDYYYMARKTDLFTDVEGDTSGSYGEVMCNLSSK